jgi:UDP-GlcNAc3NAcA epimerase
MKVLTIAGARPQFIKAATLSRALKQSGLKEVLLHTGQHYDDEMSAVFFRELDLPEPSYHLGINSMTHGAMTGRMLERIEEVILQEKPAMVIVFGDTNSTLSGALAAKKLNIPVAHVEAGLRSHDMTMPEEVNRVLTDRISDLLFCPTAAAVDNLQKEGFAHFNSLIYHCGDIMLDASKLFATMAKPVHQLPDDFVLCTIHREAVVESTEKLTGIVNSLMEINKIVPVIFPAHPRTKQKIQQLFPTLPFPVGRPFSYLQMIYALAHCRCVITDSGGLQKEAYFFKKPCITLRHSTEWQELTDARVNFLAGDTGENLLSVFNSLGDTSFDFSQAFYGTGNAAKEIATEIHNYLKEGRRN